MKSGGARGADDVWLHAARKHGFHCRVLSFEGHALASRTAQAWSRTLSADELQNVEGSLKEVSRILRRRLPPIGTYTYNLLAKNAHVVKDVEALYAVGRRTGGKGLGIDGGTGWACEVYHLRYRANIFFYDMTADQWLEYEGGWMEIPEPPYPDGTWAGIGSHKLTPNGKKAILSVFES